MSTPRPITPLNRERWIRSTTARARKHVRDRMRLMTQVSGPEWKSDEQIYDILEANALIAFVYAREIRRRHPVEPHPPLQTELATSNESTK